MSERITSGVYAITHAVSGRQYIGSSGNVRVRLGAHRRQLRAGVHPCGELQRDWDSSPEALSFGVLVACGGDVRVVEQRCIVEALRRGVVLYNRRGAAGVRVTSDDEVRAALEQLAGGVAV